MALGHGAKIVKNGLVFAYDMGPNPGANKSWKGKPTTNIFSAGRNTDNSATLFTHYFGTGASGTISSEYQGKGITAKTAVITASTNSHTNFQVYMGNVSLTGGSTYAVSAMVWTDAAFTCRIGAIQNGSPFTAYVPLNEVSLSSGWNFIFSVGTYASTVTTARFQLDFGKAPVGTTIKVIKPQIEQSNYAAPYVNGTRSNTEALLDWTGNNTITAASLTYNSDGSFEFGSGNNVTISNPVTNGQPYTILLMAKPNSLGTAAYNSSSGRRTILKGDAHWNPGIWMTQNTIRSHATTEYRDTNINWSDLRTSLIGMVFDGTNCYNIFDAIIQPGTRAAYAPGVPSSITIGNESIGGTSLFWDGQIYYMMYYDRALTADEVKTNFNALRGRYGI